MDNTFSKFPAYKDWGRVCISCVFFLFTLLFTHINKFLRKEPLQLVFIITEFKDSKTSEAGLINFVGSKTLSELFTITYVILLFNTDYLILCQKALRNLYFIEYGNVNSLSRSVIDDFLNYKQFREKDCNRIRVVLRVYTRTPLDHASRSIFLDLLKNI